MRGSKIARVRSGGNFCFLTLIETPNPSKTVQAFEGTASVAEAAALKSSRGKLIVEKQKFPPDLTLAIARIQN